MRSGMRIIAVSGKSGGHAFPALAFLEALKARGQAQAMLVLPENCLIRPPADPGYEVRYVSISSLAAPLSLLKGVGQSVSILRRFRPDAVVGFGSVVSVPLVALAKAMGARTMIHEQNVLPGKANSFLAGFADRIAVSFSCSACYFGRQAAKVVVTGNPLRPGLRQVPREVALEFFGFRRDRFTLLVAGGSQGSRRINRAAFSALKLLPDKEKLQVIHLCGNLDYGEIEESYRGAGAEAKVFPFLERMEYAYSAADLAVTRAGATTVSELIFFCLPAVVVPYPYAGGHQFKNAEFLAGVSAAAMVKDEDLTGETLAQLIVDFMSHPDKIKAMRASYGRFAKADAAAMLAESALTLL